MKPTERQKLCTSCEGRIPLDANQCPYCAVEQSTSGQAYLHHKTIQESLTSLYPPPYATKADKESTAAEKKFQQAAAVTHASISLDQIAQSNSAEEKSCFWSLFFLCVGANLLILGLLQFLFSDNGFLTLQWDSRYWFFYCLSALPLIYAGWRKIQSSEEVAPKK